MKKVTDNHRFYVVMPKVLSVPTKGNPTVKLPCGMAAAQAAHAVSKLRLHHVVKHKNGLEQMNQPITTIVKQCRDHAELQHVRNLAYLKGIPSETFVDTNDQLYGKGLCVETAVAFGPCLKEDVQYILDYLPLWDCECK